jgi:hypothetical protein
MNTAATPTIVDNRFKMLLAVVSRDWGLLSEFPEAQSAPLVIALLVDEVLLLQLAADARAGAAANSRRRVAARTLIFFLIFILFSLIL